MKTPLTAIAAAVFLLLPITGFAAYVIHLKDGTQFVTDQYFEEGDQIKFKRYGGLIGIEKERVSEIEQVENLPEETQVRVEPGRTTADGEAEEEDKIEKGAERGKSLGEEGGTKEKEQPESAPANEMKLEDRKDPGKDVEIKEEPDPEKSYKKRKIELINKLKEALESYKRAKAIGEQSFIDAEFRRASEISSDLSDLEKEVKARHDGILPAWWEESEKAE